VAAGGRRAGALRVVVLLGWRGWAAAHSGMRGEGRGAGALGRESAQVRALPFLFFSFLAPKQNKTSISKINKIKQKLCSSMNAKKSNTFLPYILFYLIL
jgi:hypothetical protein